MEDIKKNIVSNKFIENLRLDFKINEDEYTKLVTLLNELGGLLKNESTIDKELMSYIYGIPNIIRGQIRDEYSLEQQTRLVEMEIEIDSLIIELLR